jgi:hypothetical protein
MNSAETQCVELITGIRCEHEIIDHEKAEMGERQPHKTHQHLLGKDIGFLPQVSSVLADDHRMDVAQRHDRVGLPREHLDQQVVRHESRIRRHGKAGASRHTRMRTGLDDLGDER